MNSSNSPLIYVLLLLLILVITYGPMLFVYYALVKKAGRPAWSQFVPFYSTIIRAQIADYMLPAISSMIMVTVSVVFGVVWFIGFIGSSPDQYNGFLITAAVLGLVGAILNYILDIRFGQRYVVVGSGDMTPQQLRMRVSFAMIAYLKNIQYRPVAEAESVDGVPMIGYVKSDIIPSEFDSLAIIAGWLGLLSIVLPVAPLSVGVGIATLLRIKNNPERKGRARAWFAVVWGSVCTVALAFVIYAIATHPGQ